MFIAIITLSYDEEVKAYRIEKESNVHHIVEDAILGFVKAVSEKFHRKIKKLSKNYHLFFTILSFLNYYFTILRIFLIFSLRNLEQLEMQ